MLFAAQHKLRISSCKFPLLYADTVFTDFNVSFKPRTTLTLRSHRAVSATGLSSESVRHRPCKGSLQASLRKRLPYVELFIVRNTRLSHSFAAAPVELQDPRRRSLLLNILKVKLREVDIKPNAIAPGRHRLICPRCQGGDSQEHSFSLSISDDGNFAVWNCFRAKCGWTGSIKALADVSGSVTAAFQSEKTKLKLTKESLNLQPLCDELLHYFSSRLISQKTLERNHVMQGDRNGEVSIAFPYHRNGEIVNCKFRDIKKNFSQVPGAEKVFYGVDDIIGATEVIIVEGEMDKLAMEEAGFYNCVSVPDGAPASVSKKEMPTKEGDMKYQYLWNCKEYLKKAERIILATDGDLPGQALAEELARRLGKERCWRVRWPKRNDQEYFKDANEVLMYLGADELKNIVDRAELYPVRGLLRFREFFDEIDAYFNRIYGFEFGVSTGWNALNPLYNVVPGELTVVTGVPNSGKSEWIDALLCNLNRQTGWKFLLCSMENKVREHARKLLEKYIKKPFFDAPYGESSERMTPEEVEEGKRWLDDTFILLRCEDDALPSVKWVLDLARIAVMRHGVNGLVIDPYNELDHQRPHNMTETEYVSQMLTLIKRFAQHHGCHVWFVAHPRQLQNYDGKPPNLYDISGSAHFINKCDNGIVVHRNRDPNAGQLDIAQICVRKVRNKVVGTIGEAFLAYNRVTGEFSDVV